MKQEDEISDEDMDRITKDPCVACKLKNPSFCVTCAKKKRQKRILRLLGEK
jgi:hypothetical protein